MSNTKAHLITTAILLGLLGFAVSMFLWPFMGILLLMVTMIYVVVYDSIKKRQ
jgi:heme O synthase-like polyprenyltransferase